jgi:hypothetical protein
MRLASISSVALGTVNIREFDMRAAAPLPPLRGTFVKFGDTDLLLYTTGYIPYLRTYTGAQVLQPLEVTEHHGDSPWDIILREMLVLTKMDWNTADFACGLPITVAFSKRVGQILAELPAQLPLRPEYRFYM